MGQIKYVSVVPQTYTDEEKLQALENLDAYSVDQYQSLTGDKFTNLMSILPNTCYATSLGSRIITTSLTALGGVAFGGTLYNQFIFHDDIEIEIPIISYTPPISLSLYLYYGEVTSSTTLSCTRIASFTTMMLTSVSNFTYTIDDYDLVNKEGIYAYEIYFYSYATADLTYLGSISPGSFTTSSPYDDTMTLKLTNYSTVVPGLIMRQL